MSGPVFATRWDFLLATVLIGIDRSTGVFSGSEPTPGQQMVCVWTSDEAATDALHVESWDIKRIKVRELLTMLPAGIGVVVDPERTTGMTATAAYVAQLRPLVAPFPPDVPVRVSSWDELVGPVRAAVVSAVSDLDVVRELHAFVYTVDDSPVLGCLAHLVRGSRDDTVAAIHALDTALTSSGDLDALGVAAVNILGLDELPAEVRAAIGDHHQIHRRRWSRPWRR